MQNTLYTNDNLFVLYGMNSEIADLIYLDPPFNSKRMYSAPVGTKAAGASFKDMWTWEDVNDAYLDRLVEKYPDLVSYIKAVKTIHSEAMMAYVMYMAQRLIEMHRVLKSTGSLYLHCDPTASHYLKNVLDCIFGRNNFRNEIIWAYESGGRSTKDFSRKHDVILRYSKSESWVFNAKNVLLPREKTRHNHMKKNIDEDGRAYYSIKSAGKIYKYYTDEGVVPSDVWQIAHLNNKDPERTGYPTQKPLSLLHRIIKASSNEGDLVLDPFCGCATTCVAAQQLQRKWIGIDVEKQAVGVLMDRLSDDGQDLFSDFINLTQPPQRTDVELASPDSKTIKERLFAEQSGNCNGCGEAFKIWNMEIDHIVPKSKGGGDYVENYQLLCGSCNKIKGDRTMEYLRTKLKIRLELIERKITYGF
jgi:site-specific DNA-methyltransferase (adenine-specific)